MSLRVNIDYADGDSRNAPGVVVSREGVRVASWNTGRPADDWSAFIDWAFDRGEEVSYGSSIATPGLPAALRGSDIS